MAPHSSTLAWKIPWTEEPGRLKSLRSLRVGHDWATSLSLFTFHFHALEEEMATHSSVLAWRIPGTEEPGGLPSMGSHRVGHDWSDLAAAAAAVGWVLKQYAWYPDEKRETWIQTQKQRRTPCESTDTEGRWPHEYKQRWELCCHSQRITGASRTQKNEGRILP